MSYVRDGLGQCQGGEFHCGTCEGRTLGEEAFADAGLSALADELFA